MLLDGLKSVNHVPDNDSAEKTVNAQRNKRNIRRSLVIKVSVTVADGDDDGNHKNQNEKNDEYVKKIFHRQNAFCVFLRSGAAADAAFRFLLGIRTCLILFTHLGCENPDYFLLVLFLSFFSTSHNDTCFSSTLRNRSR